ncbi:LamB/YcsF family protein [Agrobacterium rhizogenes]|uniref:5-oxoprolinase subunit PxpA n=1 Tax=Rhizobium rhizogenes TaxID=359 RepID=UPI00115E446E|nr:5-oxoprolinase subunit PxpA [Rhizobium rhizogenes]KAA6486259.1 LamB/YcsF family protein [Agrobacterium sp. ICMP 7243]NTF50724.1 LamB/YcsF family protein [Rhizobium rhizogenes]NTF63779.1 LamB/YcsF family protein [Rhizobium rhizogenes]NTG02711.1 LamB/YcsF family protein [Rhizobium rhizogenes]NTG16068.1 LamB/YcsF family protein [Rhizobium rhizogenes]
MKIDLNSDMGEGFGPYRICDDEALMDVVSSANIACGFHAGDPETMARMVRLAKARGVGVGAHPGFPDRLGFGRREMPVEADEMRQQVLYQLGALTAIARGEGGPVAHIGFHAAMGNMINRDAALADLIMQAISSVDPDLIVFSMPDTEIERAAKRAGLRTLTLFLADRAYDAAGQLVSRKLPNSVIKEEAKVRARVRQFLESGTVTTIDNRTIEVRARSILVHSDTPGSLELARIVRSEIEATGATIAPARDVLA